MNTYGKSRPEAGLELLLDDLADRHRVKLEQLGNLGIRARVRHEDDLPVAPPFAR